MPGSDYYQQDRNGAQARQIPSPQPLTVVAPRPGYAAPISALDKLSRPEPAAQRSTDYPFGGFGGGPGQNNNYPDNSSSPLSVPKSPHPLQPPMSPITPIFARASPAPRGDVKFEPAQPIMRGNKEETLLPKRGERGDDFWRRFSMVVKEESTAGTKESIWLKKTQNGTHSLSRWVWIVGVILLIAVAGGIGLGVYFSHNKPDHQRPSTFGDVGAHTGETEESSAAPAAAGDSNTARIVSATHTVARRAEPTAFQVAAGVAHNPIRPSLKSRHSKKHSHAF